MWRLFWLIMFRGRAIGKPKVTYSGGMVEHTSLYYVDGRRHEIVVRKPNPYL